MSQQKIITFEEFSSWIFAQDDDRIVNMSESSNYDKCGCLMIQYARANNINCNLCGISAFYGDDDCGATPAHELDRDARRIILDCLPLENTTYKIIKEKIKEITK